LRSGLGAIWVDAEDVLKATGCERLSSINNLAVLYKAQARHAEAEPLHKRSLAIREKALGSDHPNVGESLYNLASLYHVQGRFAEAEPLYMRSLLILETALGPEHPKVGQSLASLALLYNAQKRYAEAEPLFKRSLGVPSAVLLSDARF
jgi:tetratricopeptide (TPR) repeat protein